MARQIDKLFVCKNLYFTIIIAVYRAFVIQKKKLKNKNYNLNIIKLEHIEDS